MKRIALALAILLAIQVHAADKPAITEAQMREMFVVPDDVKLLYQGEDGQAISFEEMKRRMGSGKSATLIKDLKKHEFTLTLKEMGSRPAQARLARLPEFDLPLVSGKRIRSPDLLHKPALISFFFAECAPCIKEVPILNAFARKHPEYNYLAITFDPKEVAAQFVRQHHLEWPVAANAKAYLDAAQIGSFPTYLYVSTTGEVLGQGSGLDTRSMADPAAGLRDFEKFVDTAKHGVAPSEWQPLLDDTLSKFDVYLSYRGDQITGVLKGTAPAGIKPVGFNPPKQDVFSVVMLAGKPWLRVSGEYYGCLVTKQEFSNYHFRAQVKWGEKKWQPRLNEHKDSGILYHSRGPFGVDYWKSWALSQEFQVIEHGLGEYWTQATSAFDIRVGPKEPSPDKSPDAPKWNPKAPWLAFVAPNNHALAGSDEDRPGEWNSIELVCYGANCVHIANGKVVMALANSRYRDGDSFKPLDRGKLQIQSEAAEVFYRDLEIRPITAMPAEYAGYFK
jgi:thiol-disulfide isomerase/thioredoxin